MVRIFKDQSGNVAAPMLVLVGGVSLLFAHNEMKKVNNRIDQVREESQKHFSGQQNTSSLQLAARLLVGDQPSTAAPVRVDPYIPEGPCDKNRKLTAANGGNWQSTENSITVESMTQGSLQKNSDDVFKNLSKGKDPQLKTDVKTPLKILGWKCNDTHPFLVEGVFVEASTSQQSSGGKGAKTKALLAMAAPPPSTCEFFAQDATGKLYPDNKQPSGNPVLDVTSDTVNLFLECNHVVTDANILNGGVKLAGTNSYPLTAANRIDPALKRIIGPVALTAGTHALQAIVEQVDGTKLTFEMTLSMAPPVDVNVCASKCVTLPDAVYPALCDSVMAHKPYYQDVAPQYYICYRCEKYYGFDPLDGCKMKPNPVGARASEGCFAGDTRIQMEDGRMVAIEDLRNGDRIWNPALKKGVAITNVIAGPEAMPLYRVAQGDEIVRVTRDHPFLTQLGLVAAKDLRVGDSIQGKDGGWAPIKSVTLEAEGYGKKVWNFDIVTDSATEEAHLLVANGIVTGDHYLQKRSVSRSLLEMISMERTEEP